MSSTSQKSTETENSLSEAEHPAVAELLEQQADTCSLELDDDDSMEILSVDLDASATEFLDIVVDDRDITKERGFKYPSLLLCNVEFRDALTVLHSYRRESYRMTDIWIDTSDGFVNVGTLQLDSQILLLLARLHLKVIAYLAPGHNEILDLHNPNTLMKFI